MGAPVRAFSKQPVPGAKVELAWEPLRCRRAQLSVSARSFGGNSPSRGPKHAHFSGSEKPVHAYGFWDFESPERDLRNPARDLGNPPPKGLPALPPRFCRRPPTDWMRSGLPVTMPPRWVRQGPALRWQLQRMENVAHLARASARLPMYCTTKQAAQLLGLSHRTLEDWRYRGFGPSFRTLGRAVRYRTEDLLAFIESSTFANTGQAKAA